MHIHERITSPHIYICNPYYLGIIELKWGSLGCLSSLISIVYSLFPSVSLSASCGRAYIPSLLSFGFRGGGVKSEQPSFPIPFYISKNRWKSYPVLSFRSFPFNPWCFLSSLFSLPFPLLSSAWSAIMMGTCKVEVTTFLF